MTRDPDRLIWKDVLAHLRKAYPTVCRQWFDEIELVGIDGGSVVLRAHTSVHRDYLRRHCLEQFNDSVRTVSGRLLAVRFVGPEDATGLETTPAPDFRDGQVTSNGSVAGSGAGAGVGVGGGVTDGVSNATPNGTMHLADAEEELGGVPTEELAADAMAQTIEARPAPAQPPAWSASPRPAHYASEAEPLGPGSLIINPDYDFENFIVGPSNRIAHAAGVAVSTNPGRSYNPLFIHGAVGLGKTHLLQAICLNIRKSHPSASIHYISCEVFVNDFVNRVRSGAMHEFRHRFRSVDVLVIDDIHFLTKGEQTQEEFFHTFNTLYGAHKQIVLASDRPPEDIPQLQDRLVSRFKWGLVAQIDSPTFETRIAILKSKAGIRGLDLPDDVATHIASRLTANIRELEGAITKLQLRAMVDSRPIDLDMAQDAIAGTPVAAQADLTVQTIIDVVVGFYRVQLHDLKSKKRQRSIALPRQVCMYLARKNTRKSLQEIGSHFGDRDHTTVMHAIRTVEQRREKDRDFGHSIGTLEQMLTAARR